MIYPKGANFSFVAPSSEELWVRKEIDQNALLHIRIVHGFQPVYYSELKQFGHTSLEGIIMWYLLLQYVSSSWDRQLRVWNAYHPKSE